MGFRTTIISETKYIAWPDWFVKQYDGVLTVGGRGLSSLVECKVDFLVDEVFTDIQECLSAEQSLLVLMLHECGGVTRCTIEKEKITYIEPSEYVEVNEPTHPVYECHGCTKHLTPPARWIPIESAPKDGTKVVLLTPTGDMLSPCEFVEGTAIGETGAWLWWQVGPEWFTEVKNPTHYMILPKLPEENK